MDQQLKQDWIEIQCRKSRCAEEGSAAVDSAADEQCVDTGLSCVSVERWSADGDSFLEL